MSLSFDILPPQRAGLQHDLRHGVIGQGFVLRIRTPAQVAPAVVRANRVHVAVPGRAEIGTGLGVEVEEARRAVVGFGADRDFGSGCGE